MRIFYPLFLALLLVGISCDISFFQSSFKYPYSSNNVLLDIDIQTQDATLVDIQIQIPSSSTRESNSIFTGPAFGPRTISGFSTHKRVTVPAIASISWNGIDTLTFHAIDNTPIGTSSQGNGWVNFNFYMMDSQFNSPTAPNFQDDLTKLPLDLTYDNDYTGNKPKFIDLAFDNHFNVTINTRV